MFVADKTFFIGPCGLLNWARMAIKLSPYGYSSQARMAFNLSPYGFQLNLSRWPVWPFVLPVWHPAHQPVNTYIHAHSPHKVDSSDHPNLLLFPDLHTLHIDTPCTSFNTAQIQPSKHHYFYLQDPTTFQCAWVLIMVNGPGVLNGPLHLQTSVNNKSFFLSAPLLRLFLDFFSASSFIPAWSFFCKMNYYTSKKLYRRLLSLDNYPQALIPCFISETHINYFITNLTYIY